MNLLEVISGDFHFSTRLLEQKLVLVQHNIPLAVTDHSNPLFKDVFPDSLIAKTYASGCTKTTCVLNGSLAPHFKSALVKSSHFLLQLMGPMIMVYKR